ncbi:hypothetical protein MK489_12475 [Myxococcota bacterium]|nr:hypothetical protein [Myxococcota bacterium]
MGRFSGSSKRARVVFYVSGHGYGHATRMRALAAAMKTRAGDLLDLHVRTQAPHWIFTERDRDLTCSTAVIDVGVLQPNGLDLDLPSTLQAHQAFLTDWNSAVEREARFLEQRGADLVVGDIPALAFAAAARAGVHSVAVANFSWDWILEPYAADEAGFRPAVERYAEAYAMANHLFRLPFHGEFDAFGSILDTPLLVNHATRDRRQSLHALGLPDDGRPLVLVSFGGFGAKPDRGPQANDLEDYRFLGFSDPPEGLASAWTTLSHPSPIPHEDLVNACDVILGKPGYGTVAEACAHGTRFLHLPRQNFREIPALEAGLARYCTARSMPREDFEDGRWREHLDALLSLPTQQDPLASDGDQVIAGALLEALGTGTENPPPMADADENC